MVTAQPISMRTVGKKKTRAVGDLLTSPQSNSRRLSRRRIAPVGRYCAAQRQRSVSRAYTAQQRQAARVAERTGAATMPADAVRYELLRRHRACARWRTPFASARAAVAAAPCLTTDARVVAPPRAARRVGGRRRRGRRVVGAGGSPRVRQGVLARALRTYFVRQPRGNSDARPRANGWPGAHQHLALGGRVWRRRRRRRATV